MDEIFKKHYAVKIEPDYSCESICAYKDKVLIGIKQGQIIVYSVNFEKPEEIKTVFNFVIRDFSKKPVTQIELAEEFGIFLSLSSGTIYVHRINDYRLISTSDIKNISTFCIDIYDPNELDNSQSKKTPNDSRIQNETGLTLSIINGNKIRTKNELRICIASRRKLIILNWDSSSKSFQTTDKVFKLQDYPIAVKFLYNFLCVATKLEYTLFNIENGIVKPLFNVGKCQEPFIFRVSDLLGLKIEDTVEFIDRDGNMLTDSNLRWSFVPSSLIYHPPFAISLLDKYIEIRMISPSMLIQSLPVENATLICRYLERLYILSDKKLWMLVSKSRIQQVRTYIKSEDFQVALILAKTASLVGEDPIDSTNINIMYALSLYENGSFEKSFNIFSDMVTDPSEVLNLFPSVCPVKTKNTKQLAKYINAGLKFKEEEKKEAIRALIDYLVKWRVKLRKSESVLYCSPLFDDKKIEKQKSSLQQIVDTTLLKCYVCINSPLVAPLLRQENFCHLDEAKTVLEKFEKYQELILLYENHSMHEKALILLHEQSSKTHSALYGIQPTLNYLKNLNCENFNLIYQFGEWILLSNPMEWMTIFTHWYQKEKMSSNDEKVPLYSAYKDSVLKYLQVKCPDMVIPFLERIIFENNNIEDLDLDFLENSYQEQEELSSISGFNKVKHQNPLKYILLPLNEDESLPIIQDPSFADVNFLHTCYIISLISQILSLRSSSLLPLKVKKERNISLPEDQVIYDLRIRLKMFLQSDKANYNAERVLSKLPYDAFYEERTLVLARTGKHDQALTLWIYLLNEWEQAENYCMTVYQTNKEIFFNLLSVCIEPTDPTSIGIVLPNFQFDKRQRDSQELSISDNSFIPRLDKALAVMKKHGDKLNPTLAMKLLPSAFRVKDLLSFAQNSLRSQASHLNQCLFLRNLLFYNRLWSNFKVCVSAKKYFVVTEKSKCSVCKKLMGSSAFAYLPNESLVHYGCCNDINKMKA